VTGQDGWYLSELLAADGCEVFGLVAEADAAPVPPQVQPLTGDLRFGATLEAALDASRPDEVYNLAALSSVGQSWHDPELVSDVNGMGVVRLLAAVRAFSDATGRPVRFVQASSAEIFGDAPAPQTEDTPIAPTSPYGAAKAFAHHAVVVYRRAGLPASNAILYNHESPRRPVQFVTRKITSTVARIAHGSDELLALGDLEARRDWGFAGDYMRALTLIAAHPEPGDFVVASGMSHRVRDFVAAAFAHVGIEDWAAHVRVDPAFLRPAEVREQRGDASRARTALGWQPMLSFGELVAAMVDDDVRSLTESG
jgi:GDPmannose 4,6-dehydratase